MSLTLKHFDTRLNQWLHADGEQNNSDSILKEDLNNTLLEFFLPNKEFSFGQMDEYSTASDLKNHPQNHTLLFSSKSRLLYGDSESLEVVNKLCPDRKDRGAYGSIFLGACKNALVQKLNILIVDDATGKNGGILENEDAWRLVGDCYGQISPQLYDKLTGRQGQEDYHVVQHRFGWQPSNGDDIHYRFGKGTLRPHNLKQLDYINKTDTPQIDVILPLSSFKGTDKDNPDGALKPQIEPGLYTQTIWIGEKSQSQQGQTAISQLLASFPQGMKDFVEELETQAQRLVNIQDDPRLVAQLYCETYEKRKALVQSQTNTVVDASDRHLETDENWSEDEINARQNDLFMYELIKTDLQGGHCQLLETEKVKQELSRFVQSQWRDIALGRTLTFDRAMIIPSKELKNGEIYVPWMNEGEKILNFRSPFLNSNGLCVSVNKYVEDCVAPDGKDLKGIIVVNDEDHKRIQARLEALQAEGRQVTETDPAETESERQGRDFDGDCIGVARAIAYPNLTAEAEYRNLAEHAYAPTVKLKKQSFYREDGTQPEFEEIAIFMSDSISVGTINNQVTALEALESEIQILQSHGTVSQQSEYLDSVSKHYQKLFAQENNERNPKPIREEYREKIAEIVSIASKTRTPELVEQALSINRSIYRSMIEEGCFQNQIAVDMFKSARAPQMEIIQENKRYLHRNVNYIKNKKLTTAYLNQGITPSGYSPVELLISQTNQYFQASQLESRPLVQFQDLFGGIEFTPQQKFAAILAKQEFDQKYNEASRLDKRRQNEIGPYALIQTNSGTQIEITNLTRYGHPKIWKAQTLNLKLVEIPSHRRSTNRPHRLLAVAQIDGEIKNEKPKYRPLGTVSQQSAIDNSLKAGMTIDTATLIALKPELQESQVDLLFGQAKAIALNFRAAIDQSQLLSAAAAAWSVEASRQDEFEPGSNSNSQQVHASQNKVSNFIFSAFGPEIVSRLDKLQFANLKLLTSISQNLTDFQIKANEPQTQYDIEIRSSNSLVEIEQQNTRIVFAKHSNGEYQKLGILDARTGRLPIGTKARASIVPGDSFTVTATLTEAGKPPVEFNIRETTKFSYANQSFNGEQLTLAIANTLVPNAHAKIILDGKILGELDSDSINELQKANYLENNNKLNLKLKTIRATDRSAGFIIGESPRGNLLRIGKVNFYDFKEQNFNDTNYRSVSLELSPHKHRASVFLDNKLLGVLHFNKDKETLKQLGFLKNTGFSSAQCSLQSNFSHIYLHIDPATIGYPQTWVKESIARANTTQPVVAERQFMIEKSAPFLHKLKERPTVLFSTHEDKLLGLMGLAVDSHKVAAVEQWLKSKNIEYHVQSQEEIPLETRKGVAAIYLNTNTIGELERVALNTKFGKPLDASSAAHNPYSQFLASLPNRPEQIIGKTTVPTTSTSLNAPISSHDAARASVEPIAAVVERNESSVAQTANPLARLTPLNAAVAKHMQKDVAMAAVATQFIGKSASPPTSPSSTRNYEQAWGDRANTGTYSADDTIMVSGSGPWRGVSPQQINDTFNRYYVPLLEKAIAAGSSFVIGNAAGTDKLVQLYLQKRGYELAVTDEGYTKAQPHQQLAKAQESYSTQKTEACSFDTQQLTDSHTSTSSLDSLRQWYVAARGLNKPQAYLDRITTVANEFKQGKAIPPKATAVMQADIATYNQKLNLLEKLNQLSDRDLFQLHRSVTDYLKDAPVQPPSEIDKQLVQNNVNLLNAKIDALSKKQLESTKALLQCFRARLEQNVAQLQHWENQSTAYKTWQNNPHTRQMQELYDILALPQMQERIANIQLEQQQINQQNIKHKARSL